MVICRLAKWPTAGTKRLCQASNAKASYNKEAFSYRVAVINAVYGYLPQIGFAGIL